MGQRGKVLHINMREEVSRDEEEEEVFAQGTTQARTTTASIPLAWQKSKRSILDQTYQHLCKTF